MKKILIVLSGILVLAAAFGIFTLNGRRSTGNLKVKAQTTQVFDKSITLDEVSNHADAGSCWMVVGGKVYDVTNFIPNHPGGEAILQGCGKDATEMFNGRPNDGISHSNRARDILSQFQIGVLAGS